MPTGGGGTKGNPDPSSGFTGTNVVGYNLSGDYSASLFPVQWATTPAIDCSNATDVELSFYRWLNVDSLSKDEAVIEVSNDSISWIEIWRNTAKVMDSNWILQTFDISAIADNQPTVYMRWGMGPTNNNQNYSGWNIDDVELTGFVAAKTQLLGDFEPDCDVDAEDLGLMLYYWLAACGNCEGTDLIDDGIVNLADFQALADNWLAGL